MGHILGQVSHIGAIGSNLGAEITSWDYACAFRRWGTVGIRGKAYPRFLLGESQITLSGKKVGIKN